MSTWVDFKSLRENLCFVEVLAHFKVELRQRGNQMLGYCPLPTHNGQRKSPSLSINTERKVFQCFGCGAKGNVLDFAVRMLGENPENAKSLKNAAFKLQEMFLKGKPLPPASSTKVSQPPEMPVVVNPPIDFELKDLNFDHPYLLSRGFRKETILEFGLGFCSRGLMAERIVIPLFSHSGERIAYAGRVVDDSLISTEKPRYLFPGRRVRKGQVIEFQKNFLYGANRIREKVSELTIVEGFSSLWWLVQNAQGAIVATMQATISPEQAAHLRNLVCPGGKIRAVCDGDDAGSRFGRDVADACSSAFWTRRYHLPQGKQATDFEGQQLQEILA